VSRKFCKIEKYPKYGSTVCIQGRVCAPFLFSIVRRDRRGEIAWGDMVLLVGWVGREGGEEERSVIGRNLLGMSLSFGRITKATGLTCKK